MYNGVDFTSSLPLKHHEKGNMKKGENLDIDPLHKKTVIALFKIRLI